MMEITATESRSRKAALMAGVSLVLGILFNWLFYDKIPGISVFLYILLILGGLFVLAYEFDVKIHKNIWWLAGPLLFFALMVFVRSSPFLNLFNIAASIFLLLLIAQYVVGKKFKDFELVHYLKTLLAPFQFFPAMLRSAADLLVWRGAVKKNQIFVQVLRGLVLALPILLLLTVLLSSADLIFQKFVLDLINIDLQPRTIQQTIWAIIIGAVFLGAYTYIFLPKAKPHFYEEEKPEPKTLGSIESLMLLGGVNILFLFFLIIQITYLFGGNANISEFGFTYSEYARRGFFELIGVTILSFLIVMAVDKYVYRHEGQAPWFKALSAALIIEVFVIMASAWQRLSMYEDAYGFTQARFYSHIFVIWLGLVFLFLLYKIFIDKRESRLILNMFYSALAVLAILNLLNPDAFIAKKNIALFAKSDRFDVGYVAQSLSTDAVPEAVKLLNSENEKIRTSAGYHLYWRSEEMRDSSGYNNWQSANISRLRAKKIIGEHRAELEKYRDAGAW